MCVWEERVQHVACNLLQPYYRFGNALIKVSFPILESGRLGRLGGPRGSRKRLGQPLATVAMEALIDSF